eukprot:INCI6756.1.p1 GENE.INCI6756.1~~INCI6756.1.p1  ORF type:complete len:308 (-),score=41.94 INCI6756.1:557-1480(-)
MSGWRRFQKHDDNNSSNGGFQYNLSAIDALLGAVSDCRAATAAAACDGLDAVVTDADYSHQLHPPVGALYQLSSHHHHPVDVPKLPFDMQEGPPTQSHSSPQAMTDVVQLLLPRKSTHQPQRQQQQRDQQPSQLHPQQWSPPLETLSPLVTVTAYPVTDPCVDIVPMATVPVLDVPVVEAGAEEDSNFSHDGISGGNAQGESSPLRSLDFRFDGLLTESDDELPPGLRQYDSPSEKRKRAMQRRQRFKAQQLKNTLLEQAAWARGKREEQRQSQVPLPLRQDPTLKARIRVRGKCVCHRYQSKTRHK